MIIQTQIPLLILMTIATLTLIPVKIRTNMAGYPHLFRHYGKVKRVKNKPEIETHTKCGHDFKGSGHYR